MKSTQLSRFLAALLVKNLSTHEAEKAARTTRIANTATKARRRFGLILPCILHPFTDVNGNAGTYGVYSPTPRDKELIRAALLEAKN